MSVFFPRFNAELSPIFRLADEIDRATRQASRHGHGPRHVPTFAPKFDVKETKEAYELVGELPGIEQSNVNIEWADEHTLSISGKTASRYEASSEKKAEAPKAAVEAETSDAASDASSETYHKPSIEDDEDAVLVDAPETTSTDEAEKPAHSAEEKGKATAAAEAEKPKNACEQACRQRNGAKYWVTERSLGSFRRTFTFTGRVEHDAVKASLKNGVLNITVPKAAPLQPKRVEVN